MCNIDMNHHFWEPDSEVCQCGKLVWKLNPLAWPKKILDEKPCDADHSVEPKKGINDMNKALQIRKIIIEEDRILIFGDDPQYHVIADECDEPLFLGDTIEYEPCGFNFGWFIRKKRGAIQP